MRALLLLALTIFTLSVTGEYSAPAGSPPGFSFNIVVDGFSSSSPVSAFSYVSSAGYSKLLVVDNSLGRLYVIDDLPQPTPVHVAQVDGGDDFAGLGGRIFLTVPTTGSITLIDGGGSPHESFQLRLSTGPDVFCLAAGIVVNPTNKHLYIACGGGVGITSSIIDVNPDIFVGATTGTIFDYPESFSYLVESSPVADAGFVGLAFSSTYSTLYAVGASETVTQVFGYSIHNGDNEGLVFWSSPLPGNGVGIIAGTGCLSGYLYVSHGHGLTQLDLNGVQTPVLVDSVMTLGYGGYLHYDPLDGTLLVPAYDATSGDLLKLAPPTCGGFAGPFRFFAPGEPIDSPCVIDAECSTNNCELGTPNLCKSSGLHGACQTNADCVVSGGTTDGYWCQMFRRRDTRDSDHDDQPGKKHKHKHGHDDDGEGEGQDHPFVPAPYPDLDESFFPARYGVCNINACVINNGGCDVNADCIPIGDSQNVCKCHEGYYGAGTTGTCVNPCLPHPCDTNAACSSTALNSIHCTCNDAYFGDGAPTTCILDPCQTLANNCAIDPDDALAFCRPLTLTTFECQCGAGYWKPTGVNNPVCLVNPCSDPNLCDFHASCTPTVGGTATCTCHDGYAPNDIMLANPICNPSVCGALAPGMFPLQEPFAVPGTCIGLVTGQTCQVGCQEGYVARGQTFSTCVGAVDSEASYYSVPLFECIPETTGRHGRRRDGDDGGFNIPDVEEPISPWVCPRGGRCRPATPTATRDTVARTVSLHWLPLGQSPQGDSLSDLRVSIQPAFGGITYSPSINNPWYADGVTINNLQNGVVYKFKLVATIGGQFIASDAVTA